MAAPKRHIEYNLEKGHPWERLLVIKDRRSRRIRHLETVQSRMRLRDSLPIQARNIDAEVSYEGGVTLTIDQDSGLELSDGLWDFDVVGNFRGLDELLAVGTITVTSSTQITPSNPGGPGDTPGGELDGGTP